MKNTNGNSSETAISPYLLLHSIFGGLPCVGHSFAYVAHFVFLRDVWIRTQRAAVNRNKLARHQLSHPSHSYLAIHLPT